MCTSLFPGSIISKQSALLNRSFGCRQVQLIEARSDEDDEFILPLPTFAARHPRRVTRVTLHVLMLLIVTR